MEMGFKISEFPSFTVMTKFSKLSAVLTQDINLYTLECFVAVDAERQKHCKNHQ